MEPSIHIISLGCSKNLIDSERLIKQLELNKFKVTCDQENSDAQIVIINTCGFINDAKEESIDVILQYAKAKKQGHINKLFVMGCLSERYKSFLEKEIPEVDLYVGKFDWKSIVKAVKHDYILGSLNQRSLTTPKHFAYLKISEGCNRKCSFCAIPLITGKHLSRPIEVILEEAENLVSEGVKECLIIAQDLSYYGYDLYGKSKLAELITQLSKINGLEWIKLHYAYPAKFPYDILPVIRENPKVCRYLDIALQHSSDKMLKLMRRGITREQSITLINRIRREVPGIALRTTLLVGHPGETQNDIDDLKDFTQNMKFERLGVFAYSNEEDTYAAKNYKDDIPQNLKEERRNEVMELQQKISRNLNRQKIGKELKVIIDRIEAGYYIGRSEFDSPEIDGDVLIPIKNKKLNIGEFYKANITGANEYDLFARVVGTSD